MSGQKIHSTLFPSGRNQDAGVKVLLQFGVELIGRLDEVEFPRFAFDHNRLQKSYPVLPSNIRINFWIDKLVGEFARPIIELGKGVFNLGAAYELFLPHHRPIFYVKGNGVHRLVQVVEQILGAGVQAELLSSCGVDPVIVVERDNVDDQDDSEESAQHYQGVHAIAAGATDESGGHAAEEYQAYDRQQYHTEYNDYERIWPQ